MNTEEIERITQEYSLLDQIPLGAFLLGRDFTILYWNRCLEDWTKLPREVMVGRPIEERYPHLMERRYLFRLQSIFDGGAPAVLSSQFHKYTVPVTLWDGRMMVQHTTVSAVPGVHEGDHYALFFIQDVTDLTFRIQEYKKMRDQAWEEITKREQIQRELEKANQAKSEYLAFMSHEIRTPMNAIVNLTALLLESDLSSHQRDLLETIRTSSDSLLVIINDVLDLSKIEAGRLELEQVAFDLRACIEDSLELFAGQAQEKGLELASTYDPEAPQDVIGDPTRVRQVLANLLSNAVKFTETGEVVVTTTIQPRSEGRLAIECTVRDTGIGMSSEQLGRLFRSYQQADASISRRYGGTGLGLTVSRRLAEMMDGDLWAESEPGLGSTFHFTLSAGSVPDILEPAHPAIAGLRVLLIEPHSFSRAALARQAAHWEMRVTAVGSGVEALAWLGSGIEWDLVMCAEKLPDMDGVLLAKKNRELRPQDKAKWTLLAQRWGLRPAERSQAVETLFAGELIRPMRLKRWMHQLDEFFLPQKKADSLAPESATPALSPLRLLLAEDNAVNRKVALLTLERMGYQAHVAVNGMEVLEALRRQDYDVILMDLHMPELDGLEATRAIRQEWPAEHQPLIIAMTASAEMEDRELCRQAGMDDYVSKPIRMPELEAAMRRVAERCLQSRPGRICAPD